MTGVRGDVERCELASIAGKLKGEEEEAKLIIVRDDLLTC